jgi:hypothetical protein
VATGEHLEQIPLLGRPGVAAGGKDPAKLPDALALAHKLASEQLAG